jgi:uncharacterized cupin superfamily protein
MGNPVARIKLMSGSSDGTTHTVIWDCTAGQFEWKYWCDETACVLHGSVIVTDAQGVPHTLSAGDTMFFPAGSKAHWTVDHYVRKVAVLRQPLSPGVVLIARLHNKFRRLMGRGNSNGGMPGI